MVIYSIGGDVLKPIHSRNIYRSDAAGRGTPAWVIPRLISWRIQKRKYLRPLLIVWLTALSSFFFGRLYQYEVEISAMDLYFKAGLRECAAAIENGLPAEVERISGEFLNSKFSCNIGEKFGREFYHMTGGPPMILPCPLWSSYVFGALICEAVLLLPVILLWKWERASTVLLCIFISFLTVAGVGFEYGYTIRCGYNRDSLRRELDIVRNYLTHTPFPQELLDRMKAPDQHGNIADWNQ